MRIYIMTDQEGVAGVVNAQDYGSAAGRYYEVARELTTLEVNAAVEGAITAGATDFLVVDGHGHGSIDQRLLHPRAKLLTGRPINYPFACDDSFAAAFSIGQHAKASTDGGHLSHTGSFEVEDLRINDVSIGEFGCNALFAAYFGVPMVLLTGDKAACDEAQKLIPEIETAAVKEGLKRGSSSGLTGEENRLYNGAAIHLSPEASRELIRRKAKKAVERIGEIDPFWLEPPYELVSVLRPDEAGDPFRVATCRADDMLELLRMPRRHEPQISASTGD